MKRCSPTLEGFQTMFRLPAIGLAEISWRWSFGLAAAAAFLFFIREYLSTLPITAGEMLLLRTRQPSLMLQALARIFQGSAPRAAAALVVLTLALTAAWIGLSSLGRAVTLKSLLEYFRASEGQVQREPEGLPISITRGLTSLLFLNSLRAATLLAAFVGVVGAMLIAAAASPPDDPSPGKALLIFWLLAMLIGVACPLLNWYLSLAAIFVAQAAGVHMPLGQQILLVFTLMLTSKGVAGVPRAALVILLGTVAQFNLPVEPVFIILGIDELMDMARTSLNVLGNSFATVVVAKWEKEFGTEHPSKVVQEAVEP
jgi:hypothetical protein